MQDIATLMVWVLPLLGAGVFAGLIAGLLGVGGGIVIVPVLFHIFTALDVDSAVRMHMAVGTSLATIIPTSIISARSHFNRGAVDMDLLKLWGPGLIAGVLAGAVIAGFASTLVLTVVFGLVALFVAGRMAIFSGEIPVMRAMPGQPAVSGISGTVGAISVMMGIGGGTLSVPVLNAFGFPIHRAVGTGAAMGVVIAIPGAIAFALSGVGVDGRPPFAFGYVDVMSFAIIVPATMLLAPWGARLAHALPMRGLKIAFAIFLTATAVRMLYSVF